MKKKLIVSAMGAMILAGAAFAGDGTITFSGKVTAQTCTVKGNGGTNNFTVTLPPVSVNALATAGQVAGVTPFDIVLSNCASKTGNVHVLFEGGQTVDNATGNLKLNGGGAANVQLSLMNYADYSKISIGAGDTAQNSRSVPMAADGSATLKYAVSYIAMGKAGAGDAQSTVLYTVTMP